jgi:nitroimidazol reductase NimA-like FMN-containing flavoprotein (pyridoxamine 5'-phosphate oxidase superfamily)
MESPVATLYSQFSDPDAVATEWKETRSVLESAQLFWVSTVRDDGRPHVTPLLGVWRDDALHFCTGVDEQKAHNVSHNAHVSLTTGRNSWDQGLDVVVEGDALRVSGDEELRRLATAWSTKWDGRWQYQVRDGFFHHQEGGRVIVFSVKPTRVMAYAKGNFAVTRYSF